MQESPSTITAKDVVNWLNDTVGDGKPRIISGVHAGVVRIPVTASLSDDKILCEVPQLSTGSDFPPRIENGVLRGSLESRSQGKLNKVREYLDTLQQEGSPKPTFHYVADENEQSRTFKAVLEVSGPIDSEKFQEAVNQSGLAAEKEKRQAAAVSARR